ncbi:MAG TPA: hypothetical protein VKB47_09925 [Terracidiphilus sp.]|nr:hypothetical protein [Terracidiphilus sp.]
MSHPPMSPQPDIQVCLDCGNAEFVIPEKWMSAGWLQALRPKTTVSGPTLVSERQIA